LWFAFGLLAFAILAEIIGLPTLPWISLAVGILLLASITLSAIFGWRSHLPERLHAKELELPADYVPVYGAAGLESPRPARRVAHYRRQRNRRRSLQ
jgi:hypothetical protein